MKAMPKVVLTAAPEVDLGPLVQRVVDKIASLEAAGIKMAGFITEEKPGNKGKNEIVIRDLSGSETVVGLPGKAKGKSKGKRYGKFVIDDQLMEEALLEAIGFKQGVDMYIIHEIGPLETMSKHFSNAAKMLLKKDEVAVLATVTKTGRGFVREAKRLPGIEATEVTEENESAIEEQVLKDIIGAFAMRAREGGH